MCVSHFRAAANECLAFGILQKRFIKTVSEGKPLSAAQHVIDMLVRGVVHLLGEGHSFIALRFGTCISEPSSGG